MTKHAVILRQRLGKAHLLQRPPSQVYVRQRRPVRLGSSRLSRLTRALKSNRSLKALRYQSLWKRRRHTALLQRFQCELTILEECVSLVKMRLPITLQDVSVQQVGVKHVTLQDVSGKQVGVQHVSGRSYLLPNYSHSQLQGQRRLATYVYCQGLAPEGVNLRGTT